MHSTAELARGRWPAILAGLGVEERHLRNVHGPCPLCGGQDRFRFDDKDGNGSYYCSGCGPGSGLQLAAKYTGKTMPEVSREIDQMIGAGSLPEARVQQQRDPRPALNRTRSELRAIHGSPVERYLRWRGLQPSPRTRFQASRTYWDRGAAAGRYPAMVHCVMDPHGRPATFHVTYLSDDGSGKAPVQCPKKLMPPSRDWKGGAIRLFPQAPIMGIAEGVETAMAARQLFGIPVWAAVSADNLAAFVPPDGIECLYIFADNDKSYTGQARAYALAHRLVTARESIACVVMVPGKTGTDFADEIGVSQ